MNFEWDGANTLREAFGQLLNNSFLSDIEFSFPDGRRLLAHSFVLCMRSKTYFDTFKSSIGKEKVVSVEDTSYETLYEFLNHLYTDVPTVNGDAIELFRLAKKYDVDFIETKCISAILHSIGSSTACELLESCGEEEGWGLIEEKVLEFIATNYLSVLSDDSFLNIKSETLTIILELDPVSSDNEVEVFKAVMKWAFRACEKEDDDINGMNKRMQLSENLKLIRFAAMKLEEFNECMVEEPNLLVDMEISAIRENIENHVTNKYGFLDKKRTILQNVIGNLVLPHHGKVFCASNMLPTLFPTSQTYSMIFSVNPSVLLTGLYILCSKGFITLSIITDDDEIYTIKCSSFPGNKKITIRPKIRLIPHKKYTIKYNYSETETSEVAGWSTNYKYVDDALNNSAFGDVEWTFNQFCPHINQLFYNYG